MARSQCRREQGLPGTISDFSFQSAHWVFNMVANYAYGRYELVRVSPAHTVLIRLIDCTDTRRYELAHERPCIRADHCTHRLRNLLLFLRSLF